MLLLPETAGSPVEMPGHPLDGLVLRAWARCRSCGRELVRAYTPDWAEYAVAAEHYAVLGGAEGPRLYEDPDDALEDLIGHG